MATTTTISRSHTRSGTTSREQGSERPRSLGGWPVAQVVGVYGLDGWQTSAVSRSSQRQQPGGGHRSCHRMSRIQVSASHGGARRRFDVCTSIIRWRHDNSCTALPSTLPCQNAHNNAAGLELTGQRQRTDSRGVEPRPCRAGRVAFNLAGSKSGTRRLCTVQGGWPVARPIRDHR
jgi:hypothetical protein